MTTPLRPCASCGSTEELVWLTAADTVCLSCLADACAAATPPPARPRLRLVREEAP